MRNNINEINVIIIGKQIKTMTMKKQSIYLGWRYYRDINTEDLISQLVYISSDYDTMVKTLEKEFSLSGIEFVELTQNSELKSESFGYCGGLFIEEQVVDAFWNGFTPVGHLFNVK